MFLTQLALLRKIVKTAGNYQVEKDLNIMPTRLITHYFIEKNIDIFSTGQQVDSLTTKLDMTTAYTCQKKFRLLFKVEFENC